jgi:hypothetical protein
MNLGRLFIRCWILASLILSVIALVRGGYLLYTFLRK